MSAFLFVDWSLVAAAAAVASIFGSVWLTERRERRDISDSERERGRLVSEMQGDIYKLRADFHKLRDVVLDHDEKLKGTEDSDA